jgi:hypothetical protein
VFREVDKLSLSSQETFLEMEIMEESSIVSMLPKPSLEPLSVLTFLFLEQDIKMVVSTTVKSTTLGKRAFSSPLLVMDPFNVLPISHTNRLVPPLT